MRQPLQELIAHYQQNLYAAAFSVCKNAEDAEEDVQNQLSAPEAEYEEDGTVWVYYHDQKIEITDSFDEDGYAWSKDKYMSPKDFNFN